MALIPQPTTELLAVNAMLATIGEAPVNTLTGAIPVDAAKAYVKLGEASRELQSKEWSFNTDPGVVFNPASTGEVFVDGDVLDFLPTSEPTLRLRGRRVYDPATRSFILSRSVTADVRFGLPFDELPELARLYLYFLAGRRFQDETLGDAALHRIKEADITRAWINLMDWESDRLALNVRNDSQSVQRIFQRRN